VPTIDASRRFTAKAYRLAQANRSVRRGELCFDERCALMKRSIYICLSRLAHAAVVSFCLVGGLQAQNPNERDAENEIQNVDAALAYADNAWIFGDYDEVVRVLSDWLLPTPPEAATRALVRGFARLGSSAFYTDQRDIAREAFLQLLLLEPEHRLDPLVFPAQVITLFESVRDEHQDLIGTRDVEVAASHTIFLERVVRERSVLVSMMPFGYGFFASDRDAIGTVYLLAQSGLGATSLAMYLINNAQRDERGALIDTPLNRRRRNAQVVTGTAFFGVIAINMLHGALAHRTITGVEYRTLTEPPAEFRDDDGIRNRHRGWRIRIEPLWQP